MEDKIYKKARGFKGACTVCGHYIRKGDYYSTTGTDGHGALCDLTHKDCESEVKENDKLEKMQKV